jgi:hypothetical protein
VGSDDDKWYAFGLPIGDINHDGYVGCKDLAILKAEYGQSGRTPCPSAPRRVDELGSHALAHVQAHD